MYSLCHGVDSFHLFVLRLGQNGCNFPNRDVLELRRKVYGRLVTRRVWPGAI